MVETFIGIIAVLIGAGMAFVLLLIGIESVLFLKLRSMFDRGVPFTGY
jgi:hypothetical protein